MTVVSGAAVTNSWRQPTVSVISATEDAPVLSETSAVMHTRLELLGSPPESITLVAIVLNPLYKSVGSVKAQDGHHH